MTFKILNQEQTKHKNKKHKRREKKHAKKSCTFEKFKEHFKRKRKHSPKLSFKFNPKKVKRQKTKWHENIPTTVGSRSTKTALGTCLPAPVSLKKVLKESSPPPMVLSDGIWPSGWIPCSKQYNSQQAFPIWTPACPTWIEIHSLYTLE